MIDVLFARPDPQFAMFKMYKSIEIISTKLYFIDFYVYNLRYFMLS
jgi:hypothetical protein